VCILGNQLLCWLAGWLAGRVTGLASKGCGQRGTEVLTNMLTVLCFMPCCADVFVYPGSGATTDTQVLKTQRAAQQAAKAAQVAAAAAAAAGGVREAEGTSTAATSTAPEVQPAGQPVATLVNGPVAAAGDQGDEAQPSHSTDLVRASNLCVHHAGSIMFTKALFSTTAEHRLM